METTRTRSKQEIRGVVVSDKMNKTRVIEIERMTKHGLYQKGIVESRKSGAHHGTARRYRDGSTSLGRPV